MYEYPDKKLLLKIKYWQGDPMHMIVWIKQAWNHIQGSIKERETEKGKEYVLITGGWSGNEETIEAIHKNVLFDMLFWQKSERGGKHTYEIDRELMNELK